MYYSVATLQIHRRYTVATPQLHCCYMQCKTTYIIHIPCISLRKVHGIATLYYSVIHCTTYIIHVKYIHSKCVATVQYTVVQCIYTVEICMYYVCRFCQFYVLCMYFLCNSTVQRQCSYGVSTVQRQCIYTVYAGVDTPCIYSATLQFHITQNRTIL